MLGFDHVRTNMSSTILNTEAEHQAALMEVRTLVALDPPASSGEGKRLMLLARLVADYERKKHHIGIPAPLEMIEFLMEEQGIQAEDLVPLLGNMQRVADVLAGRRALTDKMIQALALKLGVPTALLTANGPEREAPAPAPGIDQIEALSADPHAQ